MKFETFLLLIISLIPCRQFSKNLLRMMLGTFYLLNLILIVNKVIHSKTYFLSNLLLHRKYNLHSQITPQIIANKVHNKTIFLILLAKFRVKISKDHNRVIYFKVVLSKTILIRAQIAFTQAKTILSKAKIILIKANMIYLEVQLRH